MIIHAKPDDDRLRAEPASNDDAGMALLDLLISKIMDTTIVRRLEPDYGGQNGHHLW